ncbi:MAG TPA: DUF2336 domain-containing protein [Caulobacter sp.]|nr:DUF2336 domain-containing protein [Caulobacter sp.]
MSADPNRLRELIDLAREGSSERRRDLLRGLTDAFFARSEHPEAEMALFDQVLSQLAGEMEEAVRAELSGRISARADAPGGLVRRLAHDEIAVARPLLSGSAALSEGDLIEVARSRGQDHLLAISQRPRLSSAVSDVIVERGDEETLSVLIKNDGADLSREAQERLVDKAAESPRLQEGLVNRKSLPVDLLNEIYFVAEARIREKILARNAEIDPATLEAALEKGRKQMAAQDGALPADYAQAEADIASMAAKGELGPRALAALLRGRQTTRFLLALAQLAKVDFHTARRIVERRELDALSIICKAAGFEASLFLTFAVLILDSDSDAMVRARQYGQLYNDLPLDVAQRTLRFWQLRRRTGDVAVAA